MQLLRKNWLAIAVICVAGFGCQNRLHDENQQLWQQNRELQAQLAESRRQLSEAPDPAQVQAMRDEIAKRDAEIARLQDSLRQAPAGSKDPSLEGIDATYDPAAGTVTVNLPGDVLFAPGDATLKASAKATLDKIIAAIRKDYAGKPVFVDGHTDSDPIRKTADKWKDNYDLSYARAKAVMQYLTSNGINEKNVVVRAFGPNKPKGSKPASRRVEIVVAVK
jgi:chemotaxis protein MotB